MVKLMLSAIASAVGGKKPKSNETLLNLVQEMLLICFI